MYTKLEAFHLYVYTVYPQVKPVANSFIQLYNLAEPLLDKMAMVMTTIDMMKEGYGNLKSK